MANTMGGLGDALKSVGGAVKSAVKGEKILHSNDTITKVTSGIMNNGLGAGEVAYRMLKNKNGLKEAAIRTFAKNADDVLKEGSKTTAKWDVGKIAGSYIGVSAAARVASGGGLYKDKNGNTNIAGVPFI